MGIVRLFTKYKLLGDLNKYSLLLIYSGFSGILFLIFFLLEPLTTRVPIISLFVLLSLYLIYFIRSKKKRSEDYDFDTIFPLKEKDYLLVEFSSIFCAGCLPIRAAVDNISKKYNNIQIVQIEAREVENKYLDLVDRLRLSVTPTICLLNKKGELISKRLAHLNPVTTEENLDKLLRNSVS